MTRNLKTNFMFFTLRSSDLDITPRTQDIFVPNRVVNENGPGTGWSGDPFAV